MILQRRLVSERKLKNEKIEVTAEDLLIYRKSLGSSRVESTPKASSKKKLPCSMRVILEKSASKDESTTLRCLLEGSTSKVRSAEKSRL